MFIWQLLLLLEIITIGMLHHRIPFRQETLHLVKPHWPGFSGFEKIYGIYWEPLRCTYLQKPYN